MIKYAPATAALSLPETILSRFDPIMAVALLLGLFAGMVWRLGDQRQKGETWSSLWDDFAISCMIGLANLIVSAIVVDIAGAQPLYAIGIAMVIAAKGTDAMQWFADRYMPARGAPSAPDVPAPDVPSPRCAVPAPDVPAPDVPATAQRGDGTPAKPDPELDALIDKLDEPKP